MERLRVFYAGRVQGVGFRYTAMSIARGFQVSGWVRNLEDGRVELLAEGDRPTLREMLAKIAERMGGNIHRQDEQSEPPTGEFSGFQIIG